MLIYYIYAYINSKTGLPYYIGKGHGRRAYKRHNWATTPKDKRYIVMLETNLSEVGALALERRYIKWYGRKDIGTGTLLNLTDGGEGCHGQRHTEEFKKQVSEWSKKLERTESHRNNISISLKGKPKSAEHTEKIRQIKLGKKKPAWNKGLKMTEEQKQKLRKPKTHKDGYRIAALRREALKRVRRSDGPDIH